MSTIAATVVSARKPLYQSLFVQVVIALLLEIMLGMSTPDFAIDLKIFSHASLKLILMIVAPIVFCVVVRNDVLKVPFFAILFGAAGRLHDFAATALESKAGSGISRPRSKYNGPWGRVFLPGKDRP